MIWSYSSSKQFKRCQRQWYFDTKVANPKATKNPIRHEAYLLSKLQSLDAWRGSLVDFVISKQLIPELNKRNVPTLETLLAVANRLFDQQLEFAQAQRFRDANLSISECTERGLFAAFFEIEYGTTLQQTDIEQARQDVVLALTNLYSLKETMNELTRAWYRVAQRSLIYYPAVFYSDLSIKDEKVSVKAIPDLIVFFRDEPPLIVDWKVNTLGTRDHRMQLAVYAIALSRCTAHSDFPRTAVNISPTDIRLNEIQLLTNQSRAYALSDDEVNAVDSYIAMSVNEMLLANSEDKGDITPTNFPVTLYPETCQSCPYRVLCWSE